MNVNLPIPSLSIGYLAALNKRLQSIFIDFDNQKVRTVEGVAHLVSYTVATLPTASNHEGGVVYCSDETGGAVVVFSDGTNWRRLTDRAIAS